MRGGLRLWPPAILPLLFGAAAASLQRRRLLPGIRFLAPSVAAEDTDGFAQVASELGVLIKENKAPRVAPQQVPKAGALWLLSAGE